MKWSAISRRHLLQGLGNAVLALPVLPSLLPASAQAQALSPQKNFFGFPINNGVANQYNNSVAEAQSAPSTYMPPITNMQTFAGPSHPISFKTLDQAKVDGNNAAGTNRGGQVSEFFGPEFNPYLPKMSMLLGFDWFVPNSDHHRAHFGNAVSFDFGEALAAVPTATLDQVLAYSPSFYKNPARLGRSAHYVSFDFGPGYHDYSWTFSNPANLRTSPIARKSVTAGAAALWDTFFRGFTPPMPGNPPPPPLRSLLVDQVLSDYNALVRNPRLGRADKAKVEQHIALLHQTESRVKAMAPPPPVGCTAPARQANPTDVKQQYQLMNSVAVAAAACGLSHSFLSSAIAYVTPNNGDNWHSWSHGNGSNPVVNEHDQIKRCLSEIVLDLVVKLDQAGLLDNSLVVVPTEHSRGTHATISLPVVMFGSAGGVLKTGQFIDYRNWATGSGTSDRRGYPINQLFANVLRALDVPPAEFEALNRDSNSHFVAGSGYGSLTFGQYTSASNYSGFRGKSLSDWLPLLKA